MDVTKERPPQRPEITVNEVLKAAKAVLKNRNIETYALDTELLLAHVLNCTRMRLLTENQLLTTAQMRQFGVLLEKRAGFTPVPYLTRHCEFMSLPFYVDESTLIPRPDTETLVETAISMLQKRGLTHILEIGTGSGCIAVSLAYYLKDSRVLAVDISESALSAAEKNTKSNGVYERVQLTRSNLFEAIPLGNLFDAIISNPPYIETDQLESLPPQVTGFEPPLALDGGADGLRFYQAIAERAQHYLVSGGLLLLEIGCQQAEAVRRILKENRFVNIKTVQDLAGLDRVVCASIRKEELYV